MYVDPSLRAILTSINTRSVISTFSGIDGLLSVTSAAAATTAADDDD